MEIHEVESDKIVGTYDVYRLYYSLDERELPTYSVYICFDDEFIESSFNKITDIEEIFEFTGWRSPNSEYLMTRLKSLYMVKQWKNMKNQI